MQCIMFCPTRHYKHLVPQTTHGRILNGAASVSITVTPYTQDPSPIPGAKTI